MIFSDISVYMPDGSILPYQYVTVKDTRITEISSQPPETPSKEEIFDGKDKLLMPGLVNTHTHIPMSLLRGYAEGLPLGRWLNEKVFPFEDQMQGEDIRAGSMLSIAEMLRFGVTSITDMYCFCDDIAEVMLETGMRGNISRGIVCPTGDVKKAPAFAESIALHEQYHHAGDDLIRVDFSVHAEYTNSEASVRAVAEEAKKRGLRFHVHLSETLSEHEECKQRHNGMTPTAFLEDCGVFDVPVTAAHCVYLEPEDIQILKKHDATVAHNPVSNLKLGSGFAPISDFLQQGIRVTLGTDGPASNNNQNLWEEIKLASILQKGLQRDASLITPTEVLRMATLSGAESQGRDDVGQIAVGQRADLIVIDLSTPNMTPTHSILNHLAYAMDGSNILLTMVNGKVLYRKGEWLTIDIEKARFEALQATNRILNRLS